MRSCDEESNPAFHLAWAPGQKRCPWSQVDDAALIAIGWHRDYTRLRVLPFGGTDLMAEPAYVYEAIKAVDEAAAEVQAEADRQRKVAEPDQG